MTEIGEGGNGQRVFKLSLLAVIARDDLLRSRRVHCSAALVRNNYSLKAAV